MCQGVFPSAFNSSCDCSRSDYYSVTDISYDHKVRNRYGAPHGDHSGCNIINDNNCGAKTGSPAPIATMNNNSVLSSKKSSAAAAGGADSRGVPTSKSMAGNSDGALVGRMKSSWGQRAEASGGSKWARMVVRASENGHEVDKARATNETDTPHFIHAFFFDST